MILQVTLHFLFPLAPPESPPSISPPSVPSVPSVHPRHVFVVVSYSPKPFCFTINPYVPNMWFMRLPRQGVSWWVHNVLRKGGLELAPKWLQETFFGLPKNETLSTKLKHPNSSLPKSSKAQKLLEIAKHPKRRYTSRLTD